MLFNRAVFGVSAVFLVLVLGGSGAWLSDVKAATVSTEIRHKAVKRVDTGKRLEIDARVRDSEGVNVVRAYFKARDAADFSFVVMHSGRGDRFSGTLPAAAPDAGWIDYLILVKNGANQVVKSQTFRTQVRESDRVAAVSYDKPVRVFTELQQAPRMVAGFQDNIVLDVVASAARYGVVAGVTDAGRAGGVGTAGGGAQGSGTVAATAGGGAGTAVAVLGGLAVAGGVAAAAGSDEDSSGGGSDGGGGSANDTLDIRGTWNYVATFSNCSLQESGIMQFSYSGGAYSASLQSGNGVAQTCEHIGPYSCGDTGWRDSNPISRAGFEAGFRTWGCTDVTSVQATFNSSSSITVRGNATDARLGSYDVRMSR